MQYNTVGESGKDYTVSIVRGVHFTSLTIKGGSKLIYTNTCLPVCETKIAAEENAERIAKQYIK